ncbi:mercury transporter [Oscillibacter sp.]|uniref:mercury transporter n=1 Tax=Oscillibacter sp. TaxID=1945593 RepID=UPI003394D0F5
MDDILSVIVLFQILIPIGGGMRIVACLIYMSAAEDPTSYKNRIRNVLIFIVLSECIGSILHVVLGYFGGTVIPT